MVQKYTLCKQVMRDDTKRLGFDTLAKNTFCLSFEEWYQKGYWNEWNQPYTLFDGEKAISNITVNQMKALYCGAVKNYIQLGGVMTASEYRGQGLSRQIMEEVIRDYMDKCDAMFLLANRHVTEFYPKFGFIEEIQFQYIYKCKDELVKIAAPHNNNSVKKLDVSKIEDMDLFIRCYKNHNPFSKFQIIENSSLIQFYFTDEDMRNTVFYLPEEDAVIMVKFEEDHMSVYDIYYAGHKTMLELLDILCGGNIPNTTFLFTPVEQEKLTIQQYVDEDTHLFVLKGKENIFCQDKLYIPEISHT